MSLAGFPPALSSVALRSAWTPISTTPGWAANWGDAAIAGWSPCGWQTASDGGVYLRGLAAWTLATNPQDNLMFTLPPSLRPSMNRLFIGRWEASATVYGYYRIDVATDGTVYAREFQGTSVPGSWANTWCSLSGVHWHNPSLAARQPLVPGIVFYGPAPPATPQDGWEWMLPVDATNGVVWRFRYNAASASAYKWEFIGGPPLRSNVQGDVTGAPTVYTDTGASLTIPRAGDYDVALSVGKLGSNATGAVTAYNCFLAVAIAGTNGGETIVTTGGNYIGAAVYSEERRTGLAAGATAMLRWKVDGSAQFSALVHPTVIMARPVRVA